MSLSARFENIKLVYTPANQRNLQGCKHLLGGEIGVIAILMAKLKLREM